MQFGIFFEKTNDFCEAKCNACDKLYSLCSNKPKQQTICGLKNHLSACQILQANSYSHNKQSRSL